MADYIEQKNYLFENSNLQQNTQDNQNILNFLFKTKENTTIFNEVQNDYLVDNLKLDLSTKYLSAIAKEEMLQNYNEYQIQKEKRLLAGAIEIDTIGLKNKNYKI